MEDRISWVVFAISVVALDADVGVLAPVVLAALPLPDLKKIIIMDGHKRWTACRCPQL